MSKPKQKKTIDLITVLLIFVPVLSTALIFLSERGYLERSEIIFGVLGLVVVPIIISMIALAASKKSSRKIFILYSQGDTPFVSKLYDAMKVTPYKILWDKKEIHVGDHIEEKSKQLLEESSHVIVVISKQSSESESSQQAINNAIKLNKRILPVVIDDVEPPEELKEIMFADFRNSFDDGYFSLRDALKVNQRDKPPTQLLLPASISSHESEGSDAV